MTSLYLGLDLGHHSIVTASSRSDEPFNVQVDANALSNRSTPALIGLENNRILCGEEAETRIGSVPHKIVASFPQFFASPSSHGPFETTNGDSVSLESAHLFSLFFRNYMAQVHPNVVLQFLTISVPPTFAAPEVALLVEAALLAGLREGQFDVIDHLDAAFTTLLHKEGVAKLGEKAVIVVDIGFANTSVGLWTRAIDAPIKFGFPLGVASMVEIVGDILTGKSNFLKSIKPVDGRFYFRFFKVCEKALKELSMLPTTIVDLGDFEESFEKHKISGLKKSRVLLRTELENSLSKFTEQLESAISSCLSNLPERTKIASVEVVGGGSRVPFIAETIAQLCRVEKVGRGLDGSSFAAVGAGLWSAGKRGWAGSRLSHEMVSDRMAELEATQTQVEAAHAQEVLKLGRKNELESFLYKVQHLLEDSKTDGLIEKPELQAALHACRAWFDSVEDEETNLTDSEGIEFEQQKSELNSVFQSAAQKYLSKTSSDKVKIENSLTANAEYLRSNSAKETAAEKRDKHKPEDSVEQSIKLAGKNRDEGNELFKHGTPTDAMNRYMRALNIIAKLVPKSLDASNKTLIDSIALACNLNMVQCAIRLTGSSSTLTQEERNGLLKRGIACADSALGIDATNSKAKYRKAVCLDRMKETEEAKKIIDEALQTDPNNDDLQRLYSSLMSSLKEQQSKAKKFFGKMFQ